MKYLNLFLLFLSMVILETNSNCQSQFKIFHGKEIESYSEVNLSIIGTDQFVKNLESYKSYTSVNATNIKFGNENYGYKYFTIDSLINLLGLFENLKKLDLSNCSLNNLPDNIKNLKSLENLILDKNNFSIPPKFLLNFPKLKSVSFDGCINLNTDSLFIIMSKIRTLKQVSFGYLNLTVLPESFFELSKIDSLESISLILNHISDLPMEFLKFKHLNYLNIVGNQFKSVPKVLDSLSVDYLEMSRITTCDDLLNERKAWKNIKSLICN